MPKAKAPELSVPQMLHRGRILSDRLARRQSESESDADERRDLIVALRSAGVSSETIAEAFGVSRFAVNNVLRKANGD